MYIQKAVLQIRIRDRVFFRLPDTVSRSGMAKIQSQDPETGMNIPDQFFGLKTVLQIRIRGFFPVVRIETPPPPHPQPSVFSPPLVQGGYTVPSLREKGWGVPIPKRGQTLWYSMYLLRYICTLCSPAWGKDTIHRQYAYTVCVRGCVKILVQKIFCQFLI